MVDIRIRLTEKGADKLARRFEDAVDNIQVEIRKVFAEHGRFVVRKIRREAFTGRPRLISRSGRLKRSINYVVTSRFGRPTLKVFADAIHANLHEFGGVITPVTAQKLAIPLSQAIKDTYISPLALNHPSLRSIVTPRGIFLVDESTGQLTHSLRDSVTIPARLGLRRTFRRSIRRLVRKVRTGLLEVING